MKEVKGMEERLSRATTAITMLQHARESWLGSKDTGDKAPKAAQPPEPPSAAKKPKAEEGQDEGAEEPAAEAEGSKKDLSPELEELAPVKASPNKAAAKAGKQSPVSPSAGEGDAVPKLSLSRRPAAAVKGTKDAAGKGGVPAEEEVAEEEAVVPAKKVHASEGKGA
jgi:hypothetical protein